jgi:hypothetical protein
MKRKGPSVRRVDFFFKRIGSNSSANITISENANPSEEEPPTVSITENTNPSEEPPTVDDSSSPVDMQTDDQNIVETVEVLEQGRTGSTTYERDPGKRQQIWELPVDKQEEARRFYISEGPYQPYMKQYPYNGTTKNRRRFQYSYFKNFPWLEYSLSTHRAYCLPCFVFTKKPSGRCGSDTFTVKGFINWKKVNDGPGCALLTHVGRGTNSAHNYSVRCFENLKNSMTHIDKAITQASEKMVSDARLRLNVIINCIR